jgi:hypothetical protein
MALFIDTANSTFGRDNAMKTVSMAGVCMLLMMTKAAAGGSFENGNKLYELCSDSTNPLHFGQCVGYIEGAYDAVNAFDTAPGMCVPPSASIRQIVEITVDYLRANLNQRQYSAPSLVVDALGEAFPCRR